MPTPDQHLIEGLYRTLKGEENDNGKAHGNANPDGSKLTDQAVLEKMFGEQDKGEQWLRIYRGDYADYYPSPSEAVAAILWKVAFYSGNDPIQMERVIRGSGLVSGKFDKSRGGSTWLQDEITKAIAATPETYQGGKNVSSPASPYTGSDDDYTSGEIPGLICFANRPAPEPVDFLLGKAIPRGYVTILHGAGGFGKSVLAMIVAISVSGYQKECLGLHVLKCGDVLYLDSELDERGQHPRVREICHGLGIPIPEKLHYISALGLDTAAAFKRAHAACKRLGVTLLVIDSWGPLMQGDMESAKDVLRFYNEHLRPLVDLGVTVLIVDHQSRTQEGQNYQKKGAFGSVYKENLARSVLQIERVQEDREAGTLRVRVRHRKSNFSPRFDPFDVIMAFHSDKIVMKAEDIAEPDRAAEETLSAAERILAALKKGPATVKDLVADTGLSTGTIRNRLSELVPGKLEAAEGSDGRTKIYGYPDDLSSSSLTPRENGGDDRSAQETPVSFDLRPGESSTVAELKERRESTQGVGKCKHDVVGGCWLCKREIQNLTDEGMKLEFARAEVLGEEA